jgi:hypothetical protein
MGVPEEFGLLKDVTLAETFILENTLCVSNVSFHFNPQLLNSNCHSSLARYARYCSSIIYIT